MGLGSHISYGTLESANALEDKCANAVSRMSLSPSSWTGEQKKPTQQDLQILVLLYFTCRGKQREFKQSMNCLGVNSLVKSH